MFIPSALVLLAVSLNFFFLNTSCFNFRPESSNIHNLTNSSVAVWIKITSSWMGLLLFIWTLIAPVLFPDRDFD